MGPNWVVAAAQVLEDDVISEENALECFWEEEGQECSRDPISFCDLEQHKVVGTGQFGVVRIARHNPTGEVYALKKIPKASILSGKPVEHAVNERIVMEEARSKFCVGLVGAYQDPANLYLLQVGWLTTCP